MVTEKDIANRWPITASIMLATLIYSLDLTIGNVALPHIQGSLSASQDQVTWVLTSYIVVSAIFTPLSGWLADRIGRKTLFMLSVLGFTVASMLVGLANSMAEIVAYRILQGAAGAFLLPIAQAIMLDIHPPEKHGQAMAIWSAGALMGPILGPVLGGWLTEHLSWRWAFFINLPVGLLALAGVWLFISRDKPRTPKRFDFLGFFSLAIAIGALQVMLDRGQGEGWFDSPEIWIELMIVLIAFWVFVAHTATTEHPFFDPSILRDRNFVAGTTLMFVVCVSVFSSLALMPSLMQTLLGYPVLYSGEVSAWRGLGSLLTMTSIGWLMNKVDVRIILVTGFLLAAVSMGMSVGFDLGMTAEPIIVSGFIQGVATGLLFVPFTALAFAGIRPELRAESSSLFNVVRNIGSSVGISIMQAMLVRNTQIMHSSIAGQVNLSDPVVRHGLAGAFDTSTIAGLESLNAEVTRQAAMVAYVNDFKFMFIALLVCIPLSLLMRPVPRNGGPPHVAIE